MHVNTVHSGQRTMSSCEPWFNTPYVLTEQKSKLCGLKLVTKQLCSTDSRNGL